jgi:prepilin-type N-terminal cleavage/methylation domain-containing protein
MQMPIKEKYRHKSPQAGEAGFTLIEMIIVIVLISILGTFIFQVLTKSLGAQIAMQKRKERADDAVLVLERISREVRAANDIITASSNNLKFKKTDTGSKIVKFTRNTSTNKLSRKSAATDAGLSGATNYTVAENVTVFDCSSEAGSGSINRIVIDLQFLDGSEWETKIYPRNYGL